MPYQVSQAENTISASELNNLFSGFEELEQLLEFFQGQGGGAGGGATAGRNFRDYLSQAFKGNSYSGMIAGQRSPLCTPLDAAATNGFQSGCIKMVNAGTGVLQGSVLGMGGKL